MTIAELRTKRGRAIEAAREIMSRAETEGRVLSEDESRSFDAAMADADNYKATIDRMERMETEERALSESRGRRVDTPATPANDELRSYLLGQTNLGAQGYRFELRAQAVGSQAAGGYTTQAEPMAALERALKAFGGMRQAAKVQRTATGNDLPIVMTDDTANVASIVAENTLIGTGPDLVFTQKMLKAWKYVSGIILVPLELLQDSSVNIGEEVGTALGNRIARATNGHFTTGTGTGQPEGVTGVSAGVTGATLGSVSYDELVAVVHSVDAAYRKNAVWMLNDQTLLAVRKLKDGNGRPLFWSDAASLANGFEGTILGYPYIVNNDMPALGTANAHAILFGDFQSGYRIRDVQDVQIIRLNERYADTGQVAFVGISRHDGRIVDAGGHPIQAFANAAA